MKAAVAVKFTATGNEMIIPTIKKFFFFKEFWFRNLSIVDMGCSCFPQSFTDFQLQGPSCKSASDGKKLPQNPTLFQQGGGDSPFYKLTPLGHCGLAISSPPPYTPLLGDTLKAGNRSCKPRHGFMTRRQVWLNKAYSHLGWKPLPYLEIYDEDDTADYSRLLKRIGHGPASGRFSVCICVYDMANRSTVTQFCLICSSSNIHDLHHPNFPWTNITGNLTYEKNSGWIKGQRNERMKNK